MADIIFYPRNILESSTVTVTGTPDTGFPESRLYDRAISLFWKDTATGAYDFKVDQGVADGAPAIDFLAIEKHNFSSEDLEWQWSTNGSSWNDAVTDWTQDDNAQIIKTLGAALTKRYWQVTLTSMTNPKCSEIYMSLGYSFSLKQLPSPQKTDIDNVRRGRSVGGLTRSTKHGQARRSRTYSFLLSAAQLTSFDEMTALLDEYSKPFYIKDHAGAYYMARFTGVPVFDLFDSTYTRVTVNLIEEL